MITQALQPIQTAESFDIENQTVAFEEDWREAAADESSVEAPARGSCSSRAQIRGAGAANSIALPQDHEEQKSAVDNAINQSPIVLIEKSPIF